MPGIYDFSENLESDDADEIDPVAKVSLLDGMALHPERPRLNLRRRWWQDIYHDALTMGWAMFLVWRVVAYVLINALFAGLYLLQPGSIANARPGSFADAFFFSVQCISTIGFGGLAPATLYANLLTTAEAIISLAIVALATGSVFARISRPRARVMFSRHAVIGLRYEHTAEGQMFRRFYDVPLARSRMPIFALTFTVMHTTDAGSRLFGETTESMIADDTECLITVTGMEETTLQTVHARYSYGADEIFVRPALPGHLRAGRRWTADDRLRMAP